MLWLANAKILDVQRGRYRSGALVVEVVFSWPGLGRLTFDSILSRDYPVVLATTALTGILVVLGNLVADLLHGVADPRARQ